MSGWFATWQAFAQGPAIPEEEPSLEQLTALHARVVTLKKTPWADFGVFTPFNRRVMKANKAKAFIMQPDGTWLHKDVPGPATFEQWMFSWRVFRVAAIMLEIVAESALSRYQLHIEKLNKLYPECWGLIYLADDKFRQEYIDRIRRRIEGDVTRGVTPPPLWNKDAPWSAAFLEGASDREPFWDDQVRHPAVAWMASGRKGSPTALEDESAARALRDASPRRVRDAPNSPPTSRPWGQGHSRTAVVRRLRRESGKGAEAQTPQKRPRTEGKGQGKGKSKDGGKSGRKFTTTQDGKPLCFAWNAAQGKCSAATGPCANGRVHACTTCRSPNHRACDRKCE